MADTAINDAPSLDDLAAQKEAAWGDVKDKASAYKASLRKVAGLESKIAAYLVGINRGEEAVMNMVSEAALLVRADEFAEALSVYQKALRYAHRDDLRASIEHAVENLSVMLQNIKMWKPIRPILEMVERLGASLTNARDGQPGTDRFVEFSYKGTDFRVALSTTYHVTNQYDDDGYDVTTVERVEERVKEAVEKQGIADRAGNEFDEEEDDSWDGEDEDNE
jgi:hypothetical protein